MRVAVIYVPAQHCYKGLQINSAIRKVLDTPPTTRYAYKSRLRLAGRRRINCSCESAIPFSVRAAGLQTSSLRRTDAEASAAVQQLRRGKLGGSPTAQLREYNPFLLHVAVQNGLQRVKTKVPFPQFFSTMAEITPTKSLHLLWKYQRRLSDS